MVSVFLVISFLYYLSPFILSQTSWKGVGWEKLEIELLDIEPSLGLSSEWRRKYLKKNGNGSKYISVIYTYQNSEHDIKQILSERGWGYRGNDKRRGHRFVKNDIELYILMGDGETKVFLAYDWSRWEVLKYLWNKSRVD